MEIHPANSEKLNSDNLFSKSRSREWLFHVFILHQPSLHYNFNNAIIFALRSHFGTNQKQQKIRQTARKGIPDIHLKAVIHAASSILYRDRIEMLT